MNMLIQFIEMTDIFKVKFLIVLTLLYFAVSAVVAIKNYRFRDPILTNVFDNSLIPLYGAYCVVFMVATVQPEWESFIPSMWGFLDLAVAGLIAAKLKALGLPIPPLPWLGGK